MLCIWRPPEGFEYEPGKESIGNESIVMIQKAKPRGVGKKGSCTFYLDLSSHRYYEEDPMGIKLYAKDLQKESDLFEERKAVF